MVPGCRRELPSNEVHGGKEGKALLVDERQLPLHHHQRAERGRIYSLPFSDLPDVAHAVVGAFLTSVEKLRLFETCQSLLKMYSDEVQKVVLNPRPCLYEEESPVYLASGLARFVWLEEIHATSLSIDKLAALAIAICRGCCPRLKVLVVEDDGDIITSALASNQCPALEHLVIKRKRDKLSPSLLHVLARGACPNLARFNAESSFTDLSDVGRFVKMMEARQALGYCRGLTDIPDFSMLGNDVDSVVMSRLFELILPNVERLGRRSRRGMKRLPLLLAGEGLLKTKACGLKQLALHGANATFVRVGGGEEDADPAVEGGMWVDQVEYIYPMLTSLAEGRVPNLTHLHLNSIDFGRVGLLHHGCDALEKAPLRHLAVLTLDECILPSQSMMVLLEAMFRTSHRFSGLWTLKLNPSGNVSVFAGALRKGLFPDLRELDLRFSEMGDEGLKVLMMALVGREGEGAVVPTTAIMSSKDAVEATRGGGALVSTPSASSEGAAAAATTIVTTAAGSVPSSSSSSAAVGAAAPCSKHLQILNLSGCGLTAAGMKLFAEACSTITTTISSTTTDADTDTTTTTATTSNATLTNATTTNATRSSTSTTNATRSSTSTTNATRSSTSTTNATSSSTSTISNAVTTIYDKRPLSNLQALNIWGNELVGAEGARYLANAMAVGSFPALREMDLFWCGMKEEGARYIGEVLMRGACPMLKKVKVGRRSEGILRAMLEEGGRKGIGFEGFGEEEEQEVWEVEGREVDRAEEGEEEREGEEEEEH